MTMRSTRNGWLLLAAIACQAQQIQLDGWTAIVNPSTLAITMRVDGQEILAAAGEPNLRRHGFTHTLTANGRRLLIRIESPKEQTLTWPRTGADPRFHALILPEGEGLYVPNTSAAWRRRIAGRCYEAHGQLSMPFWSFHTGRRTITFHTPTDLRTDLCVEDNNGRLHAVAAHHFLNRDQRPAYEIELFPGGPSPIAPALDYREGLHRTTLLDKIRANPEIAKLLGALHMYVWGDGRTPAFIAALQQSGIARAWIGYDQNEATQKYVAGPAVIAAARHAGFLIGPYDTYANAQDPVKGEDPSSRWPGDLFPKGCIVKPDGKPLAGFAARGCELSSEALERLHRQPLAARLDHQLRHRPSSYFLDVDAFGQLYDDYSPAHPMTKAQDRANRLARMSDARARGVVLGSEHGAAWSVPVLDFGHGIHSVQNSALWGRQSEFGGWWPPDRPRIFFQTVDPGPEFVAAKYDPAFRLPLYQAAFHDAVVSTDRWDAPLSKFPALMARRQLLELLYGVPSIWAMDLRQWKESQAAILKLQSFFDPLHREIGLLPLTAFAWLTPDRLVQQTHFGNTVTITANFSPAPFNGIPPGCLEARRAGSTQQFCPWRRS